MVSFLEAKIKKLVTLKKDDIHFLFFLFAIGTLSNSEAGGAGVGGRRRYQKGNIGDRP